MDGWQRRPAQRFWIVPEQVAAHRACVAFIEWMKQLFEGPLHRAGELPQELTFAACEMTMCIAAARTQAEAAARLGCFRAARRNATRCGDLLDTPEALELGSAEELDRGQELLRRVLELLDRLIRPPPGRLGPPPPARRPHAAALPYSSRMSP